MGGIEQFFLGTGALPAMPKVARQLIASFGDEDTDLDAIVRLTARDQALAPKVLRAANSGRLAHPGKATSLAEAAELLGMERMRKLVLAASLAGAFPRVQSVDRIGFWKHAIATGGYAQWLARILGADGDSSFLAGFLLRSGQLLIAQALPEAVAQIERACTRPGARPAEERRMLGCNHCQVTAELARRWKLPQRLVEGFARAAAPLDARPFSLLAAVLNLAAVMADAGALRVAVAEALEQANAPLLQHLRLDVPWLESTAPTYEELSAPIEELLAL